MNSITITWCHKRLQSKWRKENKWKKKRNSLESQSWFWEEWKQLCKTEDNMPITELDGSKKRYRIKEKAYKRMMMILFQKRYLKNVFSYDRLKLLQFGIWWSNIIKKLSTFSESFQEYNCAVNIIILKLKQKTLQKRL